MDEGKLRTNVSVYDDPKINFSDAFPLGNWTGPPPGLPQHYMILFKVVYNLNLYFIPVIIILGFIGNALSMIVFLCTYLKRLSLSVYLAALAASDTIFLLTLCMHWLEYVNAPVTLTNGVCQVTIYLVYCSSFLSVWLVVCFTVERYIAICHPLKRPELCTTYRAKLVVASLTLASLIGYSPSLWTSGIEYMDTHIKICTPLRHYTHINIALRYADTVVTLIIPFLLIVILNIKIAHRISYFYKRRQAMQPSAYYRRASSSQQDSLYSRAQINVTKMLLLLSSMFLLINLPFYAMRLRVFIMDFVGKQAYSDFNSEFFIQQLLQIVYYISFAINFLIYCLFSTKFRDAFKRFWWQLKYKAVRLIALGIYRIFRRDDSSTASGEHDLPVVLPLRHHYSTNTKFYV